MGVKILVVVDMQNDFIIGSLGTKEAVEIVPKVAQKISAWKGEVYFTQDTHRTDYLSTQEGKNLPVEHCIMCTGGWDIHKDIIKLLEQPIDFKGTFVKNTFGCKEMAEMLGTIPDIEEIQLVGLCTDICVISNALLFKCFLPEVPIVVDASCCAGVTPESHKRALEAMKMCQIKIIGEE